MLCVSSFEFLTIWKLFSGCSPESPKRIISKGKGFMLGDQFSLNSSFPDSYPHGNKHLTELFFAISTKWLRAALSRGAAASWRWGIVVQHNGTRHTCPAVGFVAWSIYWWLWDGGKEKDNTYPNYHHHNPWCSY